MDTHHTDNGAGLHPLDVAILAIEARTWRYAGAKEATISAELGMNPTRYYQRLSRLVETRAALEHDPVTVHRIRRLRTTRKTRIDWARR